jgi:hypothetical protein
VGNLADGQLRDTGVGTRQAFVGECRVLVQGVHRVGDEQRKPIGSVMTQVAERKLEWRVSTLVRADASPVEPRLAAIHHGAESDHDLPVVAP